MALISLRPPSPIMHAITALLAHPEALIMFDRLSVEG
jgi:hypothetical protein